MKVFRFLTLLLLVSALSAQQVQRPPVPFGGPVGAGGPFPFFNTGTITLSSDADYTLAYPDTSASVLRITTATGVSLSTTRNIIAPQAAAPYFGFEFTIQNATAGGQSIIVKGATGSGVTIPNGQAMEVIYDGTNYVSVGSASSAGGGGFGFVVPTQYPTISSALSAAQAAGSGPVVVLPSSTDNTPYNNLTAMRIQNYKQTPSGADSLFFRDVSEWGPIDGKVLYCNIAQGSNNLVCGGVNFSSANAPAGDVNKLVLVDGAGPPTGQITGTMTVSSVSGVTGSGVPNGYEGVIFTDAGDGCNDIDHMPYAYIQLDATGMPAVGTTLNWTDNFYGKGCTRPPTQGTINTVSGTVSFSGGSLVYGDLVSTISAVVSSNTVILADAAVVTSNGTTALYGTDVHDTFQAACNSISAGGLLSTGTLTFSGIGLTSHGIDCTSAGLHIIGTGYEPLGTTGAGSTLVFAGKTPNSYPNVQYVLNLQTGGGEKIERMGIRGNTVAMPYGLMLSFTPSSPGNWINQMGVVDQLWIGWQWGDTYGTYSGRSPRFQSNVFSNGVTGNNDFWSLDHMYLYGGDTCLDSLNDQATNWHWGKVQTEMCNIGLALVGYQDIDDYYTEFNRVDFTMGSPYSPGGFATIAHFKSYGGESSAMETENPVPGGNAFTDYSLTVDTGGLGGGGGFTRPDGISSTYSQINMGLVKYMPQLRGKVVLPYVTCGASGSYGGLNFEFGMLFTTNIVWTGDPNASGCDGWAAGGHLKIDNPLGAYNTHLDIPLHGADYFSGYPNPNMPLMLDINRSQTHIGSLNVTPPSWGNGPAAAYGTSFVYNGTAGTTTFNYQITCVDSLGGETIPSPVYNGGGTNVFVVPNAAATLNGSNYVAVTMQQREGCPNIRLYGDNGVGGCIGRLVTLSLEQLSSGNLTWDTGAWPKDCNNTPPTTSTSGSVWVGGGLNVAGNTSLNNVTINGTCTGPGCGTGGGGGNTSISALTSATGTNQLHNGSFWQDWRWHLAGTDQIGAFNIIEDAPSTNTGNSALFAVGTTGGSTISVARFTAQWPANNGLNIDVQGNINAIGNATFIGPVRLPALPSAPSLATDPQGNIIAGTGGGGPATSLPYSSLTDPVPNHETLLNMGTGTTLWETNVGATGSASDYGIAFGINDNSTVNAPAGFPRQLLYIWSQQPDINPLDVTVNTVAGNPSCGSPDTCGGMYVDGGTGNIVMQGNSTVQIPTLPNAPSLATDSTGHIIAGTGGGGGPVSFANITSGTTGSGQILNVGLGSQLKPDTSGGAVIANILGAPTTTGGVSATAVMPQAFTPGYLRWNGTALVWDQGAGGANTALSSLTDATSYNQIHNGSNQQDWRFLLTGAQQTSGLNVAEDLNPSTNINPLSALFAVGTSQGSTVWVSRMTAQYPLNNGFGVDPNGNPTAIGAAKFVGPVQLTGLSRTKPATKGIINIPTLLGADANGNIVAAPPITLDSVGAAAATNVLHNGSFAQDWRWSLTGTQQVGAFNINEDLPASTVCCNSAMLGVSTQQGSTVWLTRMMAQFPGLNGFGVDPNGNPVTIGSSTFIGPVRLPALVSAPSLATDPNGNIIAGTGGGGGGSTSWSSLTPATADTSIANGNWRTVWGSNFTGDSVGGNAYSFQQNGTGTGSNYNMVYVNTGSPNVTPFLATNSAGNGLRIGATSSPYNSNIIAQGTSKFVGPVQLTGLNNAASLATDATGNIVAGTGGGGGAPAYSGVFTGVSMGAVGPITLTQCPGFTGGNCPAITPTVNTTYRLFATVTQTQPGSGCGGNGTIQMWISYTDADSGYAMPIGSGVMSVTSIGAPAPILGMNMGTGVNNNQNMFNITPIFVNVQQNSTFQFRIQQTVAQAACSPQPVFTVRVALFSMNSGIVR